MDDEKFSALHMDDVDYINRLILWQEPERLEKYINTWNAVKATE